MTTVAGDTLVRAGTWNGQAVVNVYPSRADFDFHCPKATIPIGLQVTVHALAPMGDATVLVLGTTTPTSIVVIAVPLDGGQPTRTTSEVLAPSIGAASPFIAYHPITGQVLFGFEGYAWATTGALGPVDQLMFTPDPEHFYAAVPLPSGFAGIAEWAVVGRRANLYMLVDGTAMIFGVRQQVPHTSQPYSSDVTSYEQRIAHAPHVSPRGVDRLAAYSISLSSRGDLTLLLDNGTDSMVSTTEVNVSSLLDGAAAQDVAMVALPDGKHGPLVLRATQPYSLALPHVPAAVSIDVGTLGPDAHVVVGALAADSLPRALVLVDAPGKNGAMESCVVIEGGAMTRCD